MNKNITSTIIIFSLVVSLNSHAEPLEKNMSDWFYELGGGRALPQYSHAFVTYRIGSRFTADLGYSCGRFDFETNVENAINRVRGQIENMPNQLGMAATEMISALPLYLVKNYAPDIYGLLTKNLDWAIDLFRFQYKTCQQLESEMLASNDNSNPFANAVRASVMNRWTIGVNNNETTTEVEDDIIDNPGSAGINFLGNGRGVNDNPIPIKHDLMVLAYNNRLGRTDNPLTLDPYGGNDADTNPLVQIWPTPEAAAEWVVATTGEMWLSVDQSGQKDSAPGVGIRPEIDEYTRQYDEAIRSAVINNDFTALDEIESSGIPSRLRISDSLIQAIRSINQIEQGPTIARLASDIALNIVTFKVDMASTLLRSAEQDPDIITSQISGIAKKASESSREWLREEVQEIAQMVSFGRTTNSQTALQILNYARSESVRGLSNSRSVRSPVRNKLDGVPVTR